MAGAAQELGPQLQTNVGRLQSDLQQEPHVQCIGLNLVRPGSDAGLTHFKPGLDLGLRLVRLRFCATMRT